MTQIGKIEMYFSEVRYKFNQYVYSEGDKADLLYFIKEGQIEVTISCCSLLLVINEYQFEKGD